MAAVTIDSDFEAPTQKQSLTVSIVSRSIYSVFKCSFDEFVGEKVFSPSYSSAILAPPQKSIFLLFFQPLSSPMSASLASPTEGESGCKISQFLCT